MKCENCKYFEVWGTYYEINQSFDGHCRRHAPSLGMPKCTHNEGETVWPRVDASQWCGDFVQKEPPHKCIEWDDNHCEICGKEKES